MSSAYLLSMRVMALMLCVVGLVGIQGQQARAQGHPYLSRLQQLIDTLHQQLAAIRQHVTSADSALQQQIDELTTRIEALEQHPAPLPGGEVIGGLAAINGRWDFANGVAVGVLSADAACRSLFPGSRVCAEGEVLLAAARGLLPVGSSWWLLNFARPWQCAGHEAGVDPQVPWIAHEQGGTALTVDATGLLIHIPGATLAGCTHLHQVACCQR